jgi:hypothetical protein
MASDRAASVAVFPRALHSARKGLPFMGNLEPSLDEVMDDDVVRRVMARDGVDADHLRSLIAEVRTRLL